jgi:hypothetical protein
MYLRIIINQSTGRGRFNTNNVFIFESHDVVSFREFLEIFDFHSKILCVASADKRKTSASHLDFEAADTNTLRFS